MILSPIEQSIKSKIVKIGVPLKNWDISINYGIKTGFNDAFIIDEVKRTEILARCNDPAERKRTNELIRPILRGRDIKRYSYNWAGLYLLALHNGIPEKDISRIDIKNYPAIKAHLDSYWQQIKERADQGETPYNLRSCAYMDDFSKPKIVWGEISDKANFALDVGNHYFINNKCYLMVGENLAFLTCFLNSYLSEYLFSKIATTTGVGTLQWSKFTIEQLPAPRIPTRPEKEWKTLLARLQNSEITTADINSHIYALCKLSAEEITFIENYAASI